MSENIELPFGWEPVTLREVTSKSSEKATPSAESSERFLGMDCIERNALRPFKNYSFSDFKSSGNRFVVNQVLYGRMRPYLNKVFKATFSGVCSGEFIVLNCTAIAPELLQYVLHHRHFVKFANSRTSGDRPRITFEEISSYPIHLPPFAEQHRIVSKIEELFSSLDKGVESLKLAQQQLKVYRQAVLKWAFEGKLTNERVTDAELPASWQTSTLAKHCDMRLGKMLDKAKNLGRPKYYLRNVNVRWGSFDLDDLEQMKFEEAEDEKFNLIKGDLVICEGGEPGRCAIWNEKMLDVRFQKALHRVRTKSTLSTKYLYYFLYFQSKSGLLENYFTGTTIKHLTGEGLKSIKISFPTIISQQAIVSEIENRLSICDKIEEGIEQSLQQAEALRQSILKKAFEGKLVPQDPNDEPASALLERIRVENHKTGKPGKIKNAKRSRQAELVFEAV